MEMEIHQRQGQDFNFFLIEEIEEDEWISSGSYLGQEVTGKQLLKS